MVSCALTPELGQNFKDTLDTHFGPCALPKDQIATESVADCLLYTQSSTLGRTGLTHDPPSSVICYQDRSLADIMAWHAWGPRDTRPWIRPPQRECYHGGCCYSLSGTDKGRPSE